jgi:Fe-S cluster assembly scaffold protein SufB
MELKLDKKKDCTEANYLYRYEDDHEAIRLREFRIVKETPCGWWIKKWSWFTDNNLKFVYKTGKNNFAKKTKEEAIENYYYRKCRHVAILSTRLRETRHLLDQARVILESQKEEKAKANAN